MREWSSQLLEFRRRSMDFEADQIRNLECLREHGANILKMREQRLGIDVAFATEDFVVVDGELVEKILRLPLRLRDKIRQRRLDHLQFARMHLKVWMETNEA